MPRNTNRKPRKFGQKQNQAKGMREKQPVGETSMRIIGGHFRGRKLKYAGDTRVRPMKDRVREALFNLLGPAIKDTFAIDLFGGTGALVLEAISRGSIGGIVIERHLPTSKVIRENIETLDLTDTVELVNANTFHWLRQDPQLPSPTPWVVFISPPYRFFTERRDDMLQLTTTLLQAAPVGSLFAVEATKEFDFSELPMAEEWDVRPYPPAVVGVITVTDSIRSAQLAGSD